MDQQEEAVTSAVRRNVVARATPKGRVSRNHGNRWYWGMGTIIAPPDYETDWRVRELDADTIEKMRPSELMEALADLSPEISKALWDWLRMCNPGYEYKVFRKGSEEEDERAKGKVDDYFQALREKYGTTDIPINRLFTSAYLRGSFVAEMVLDARGREGIDLATPDPYEFRFKEENDDYLLGQWQGGQWVDLSEIETLLYIPVDPFPGSPYGRPIASPAVFNAIFLLGLMHDIRRVIAQQGYPRIPIAINYEMLSKIVPPELKGNPTKVDEWVNAALQEIKDEYGNLEPDDAYVYFDFITVNPPLGATGQDSLGAVEPITSMLERMGTRATKTMPLQQAITDGVSEANSNRQWEIQAAGIKSIQHLVENALERLLTILLEAQGVVADVEFRFAELRSAEALRDAQVEALTIANAAAKRDQGWTTQEEASIEVTGNPPAVAEYVPPAPPNTTPEDGEGDDEEAIDDNEEDADDAMDIEADGSNRRQLVYEIRATRRLLREMAKGLTDEHQDSGG